MHSPYGTPVHAPWALAINTRLRERYGVEAGAVASDDGIVLRIPDADQDPPGGDVVVFDAEEIEEIVTGEVGGSALFASRFRECAARALLLPRRDPGRRSPLWQQRQRSAQLLEVAAKYPSFPIVLEAVREVVQDVYDVPALVGLMKRMDRREVRVVDVTTQQPSPYARSLLFGYVAQFVYEGDSPIAERRAAALQLDQGLLAELLGRAELRELLDPEVLTEVEAELQRLAPDRRARDAEGVADLLRMLGPLTTDQVAARVGARRRRRPAGSPPWPTYAGWWRSGSRAPPTGPRSRTSPGCATGSACPCRPAPPRRSPTPSRTRSATWSPASPAPTGRSPPPTSPSAFGLGAAVARQTLQRLAASGRVLEGEFRPAGSGSEWCDAEVLRKLRRRSLARLRKEVEPVEPEVLGRFLPQWQHVVPAGTTGRGRRSALRGLDGVISAVEQLAGCPVPASALEPLVLAARVSDYEPAMLDELTASGEVTWAGHGSLPGADGWVSLHLADQAPLTLPDPGEIDLSPLHISVMEALAPGGAWFFRQLATAIGSTDDRALSAALWELVWSGRISNDTLAPLRALTRSGSTTHRSRRPPPRARAARTRPGMPARGGPAETSGRWSLLPERDDDPTRRAHATAEALLERHGVVTRGAVGSERVDGGFAAVYKVLSAFEESGRCRRGYFVSGLGAAQFGTAGAIDRLRTFTEVAPGAKPDAVALAATDPANPYGAALAWPDRPTAADDTDGAGKAGAGHRPGRKAGAMVVLVDGALTLYVERGGRTLLTFTDEPLRLGPACAALADAVRRGALGRLTVEKADGEQLLGRGDTGSPLRQALADAGFVTTPRGLRIRA